MNIVKKVYRKLPIEFRKKVKEVFNYKNDNKLNNEKYFTNKLMKFDVISFDIFDTLISRTIYEPDDIFKLMECKLKDMHLKEDFLTMRKNAENCARKKLCKDVNLDEIYDELGKIYGYDLKKVNTLKKLEISLEISLTIPRKVMLSILKKLVNAGKKVILTSDMYLNKYIIVDMLEKNGYLKGVHYQEIYLSNELNMRKDDEKIWIFLKEKFKKTKFIHVGDNISSDYNIPIKLGLKAFNILSSKEQLKQTEYFNGIKEFIDNRSISDSVYLGYIINEVIFNSPFENNISNLEQISKSYIAPMIYELLKFVDSNTKDDEKLLFLAREGYYLEKLYDNYVDIFNKKRKDHYYFLASRRATMCATIENNNDIFDTLNRDYEGTVKSLLQNVYGIKYLETDFDIKLPNDIEKIKNIVKKYSKDIILNARKNKEAYIKYINQILNPKKDKFVIIDLGYSGTIQYNLSKMLKKDLNGFYLTNNKTLKKYSDKSSLKFAFDINDDACFEKIYNYSLILEYFLSAPYGQLQYFEIENDKAKPIYNNEKMDKFKQEKLEEIYKYVKEFLIKFSELNQVIDLNVNKKLICNSNTSIVESNIISLNVKDQFQFIDSFNRNVSKNVFKIISRY